MDNLSGSSLPQHVDNMVSLMGLLQISGALILVLILIFGIAFLIRRSNMNIFNTKITKNITKPIEVLYSMNITPIINLKLIKIDKYVLLIGCTNQNVKLLKEFNEQDSIVLEQKCRNKLEGQFFKILLSHVNSDKELKSKKDLENKENGPEL